MNRYIFSLVLLAISAVVHAAEELPGEVREVAKKSERNKWSWENIKISNTLTAAKQMPGEKVYVLAKNNGKWTLINPVEFSETDPNHEVLGFYMDQDTALLRTLFTKECPGNLLGLKSTSVECYCTTGLFSTSRKGGYDVCSSNFGAVKTTAGGAVSSLLGVYSGLILASPSYLKELDVGKIKDTVIQADLLSLINSDYYERYRKEFDEIRSSSAGLKFIDKYKGYDPDLLIPSLNERVVTLLDAENKEKYIAEERSAFSRIASSNQAIAFVDKYQANDPEKLVPSAKELIKKLKKQEEEQQKLLKKQEEALQKELAQKRRDMQAEEDRKVAQRNVWRSRLKVGDDTFCGMVIEAKSPMFKIAVNTPLQGYASEVWLRADQIYEPSAGCRNTNGRLSPISL